MTISKKNINSFNTRQKQINNERYKLCFICIDILLIISAVILMFIINDLYQKSTSLEDFSKYFARNSN